MTTASLHREMVEALRNIANADDGNAWKTYARAALEGWEKRPRLSDDMELREKIGRHLQGSLARSGRFDTAGALAIVEAHLYGERG